MKSDRQVKEKVESHHVSVRVPADVFVATRHLDRPEFIRQCLVAAAPNHGLFKALTTCCHCGERLAFNQLLLAPPWPGDLGLGVAKSADEKFDAWVEKFAPKFRYDGRLFWNHYVFCHRCFKDAEPWFKADYQDSLVVLLSRSEERWKELLERYSRRKFEEFEGDIFKFKDAVVIPGGVYGLTPDDYSRVEGDCE